MSIGRRRPPVKGDGGFLWPLLSFTASLYSRKLAETLILMRYG